MVHIDKTKCAGYVGGLRLYANVWRLIDYSKSVWVKAYTIRMPAQYSSIQVLDALDDGRKLLLLSHLNYFRRQVLQFFNPSTEAFTDIKEMAQQCNGMALYTGSLLST
jgi:hypothetical protein